MQFAKLKEQNLKRKKDVERSLAEWYATLELKQAIELLKLNRNLFVQFIQHGATRFLLSNTS